MQQPLLEVGCPRAGDAVLGQPPQRVPLRLRRRAQREHRRPQARIVRRRRRWRRHHAAHRQHARLAEQSKGLYDPKLQSPELWTKFLSGQAPVVQNLMGSYLEQSRKIFMQMQEQLNKQAESLIPGAGSRNTPTRR